MSCPPLYILKDKNIVTSDLCFLPDTDAGKLKLLSAYRSGSAEFDLWDLKSRRVEQGVQSDKPCNLLSIGCSNGNIVTLDKNGWLKAYDNNTIKNFVKLGIGESVGFCKASLLHASDLVAVPGCAKSSVTIWNIKDSQIVSRLVPGENIKNSAWSCVSSCYKTTWLWDMKMETCLFGTWCKILSFITWKRFLKKSQ